MVIPGGATFGGIRHTLNYFQMIPKQKITFAPSIPKYEIQEVDGVDGELDYSEEITGHLCYNNRKGTLDFLVLSGTDYQAAYAKCMVYFDGTERTCVLDDDPNTQYRGRFWLNEWKSWEGYSLISIDYDIEPHTYSESDIYTDWLWDDMELDNTRDVLYYWSFDVAGEKWRNLYNPTNEAVTLTFTCSAAIEVEMDGVTYQLPAGTTSAPGFTLDPGENIMLFTGTGSVSFTYPTG